MMVISDDYGGTKKHILKKMASKKHIKKNLNDFIFPVAFSENVEDNIYMIRNEKQPMIKVFQIADQEALHPACTFTYGMPVSSAFKPEEHMEKYEHVADIAGDDLNKAFEYGNIGPEVFIKRYGQMHSLSVGDILELNGEKFIIARAGFDKLEAA